MAFIRITKNREGKKHVYLAESYRVNNVTKQRILFKFGKLEELEKNEPDVLERLKKEAKEGKLSYKEPEKLFVEYNVNTSFKNDNKNYGFKILSEIYKELGIERTITNVFSNHKIKNNLNKILELLTIQRILNPQSKKATLESKDNLFGKWNLDDMKLEQVYRSLDRFSELSSEIQFAMHKNICKKIGRTALLVFYDVTNYYFETDMDDEDKYDENTGELIHEALRKRGVSKEKRPNPIVQMGLFMDQNGIPICYQLFRGNMSDVTTYKIAIEQVKNQFGLERIVVVADKAMNSKQNVTDAISKGDGWLFSQKIKGKRGVSADIQSFALSPDGWSFNPEGTFGMKSKIRTRKLDGNKEIQEKMLVTWNKKYAVREKIRRDGALEYAEKLTQPELFRMTAKKGGKKYLELIYKDDKTGEEKFFHPFINIDYEQVEYDEQFDGLNVIVTSELEMDDEEILIRYKELANIEDCFRVTKTELEARPVYVWTKSRIEGHFLTCFIALTILRILQLKTNKEFSPARLISALNSALCNEISNGYWNVNGNVDFVNINKALNISWNKSFVKFETLNNYSKGWFNT